MSAITESNLFSLGEKSTNTIFSFALANFSIVLEVNLPIAIIPLTFLISLISLSSLNFTKLKLFSLHFFSAANLIDK